MTIKLPRVKIISDGINHKVVLLKEDGTEEIIPRVSVVHIRPLRGGMVAHVDLTIDFPIIEVEGELGRAFTREAGSVPGVVSPGGLDGDPPVPEGG